MNAIASMMKIRELQKRIFYTLFILAVFRLGSHLPISGVDIDAVASSFSGSGILGFFNLFSGGSLVRFSIFSLGILPYINASIIIQLLTFVYPELKKLMDEGDHGRKQVAQYTRYLAIALSVIQGLFLILTFRSFMFPETNFIFFICYALASVVAGSALVMWFGELITEFGIGNGASLIIFIGIVSQMPTYVRNTMVLVSGGASKLGVLMLGLIFIGIIISIVFVQEAFRKIPVQYAKRIVGRRMIGAQNTFIPLRLIQGGVMPIIFASAVMQFPLMIGQYIPIESVQHFMSRYFRYDAMFYNFVFCFLIFFFAYFYTAISFNPSELADNIKKYGGFIIGVRPGKPTVNYLEKIVSKLTFMGAMFLAFVALAPLVTANLTHVTSFLGLGGTALLIIVGVAMDLVKQVESFLINSRYEGMI